MKKLVLFFAAVLLTAISSNLYAQNTGETPTPGSSWAYSVMDNGNTYTWSVTVGDLVTDAGVDAVLSSTSGAAITIAWASTVTIGDWYYVHVVEDDGSCTNEKVLPVQITASQFYLSILASPTNTGCYDGPVAVTLDGNTPKYNHGTATVSYDVTPHGMGTATDYSFDIAELFAPTAGLSSDATVTSGNGTVIGGTVTVTNANAVTLQFIITNATLYDNSTDPNGTAADFNQKITHSGGINSHGLTDNGTGPADANTNVARPHTTTIGTN